MKRKLEIAHPGLDVVSSLSLTGRKHLSRNWRSASGRREWRGCPPRRGCSLQLWRCKVSGCTEPSLQMLPRLVKTLVSGRGR